MLNLKQNNERLQRLVTSRSLAGSQSSLGAGGEDPRRFSLADQPTMHQVCAYDVTITLDGRYNNHFSPIHKILTSAIID